MVRGGNNFTKKTAKVLTSGGLQGFTVYDENFILSLLAVYKPDLLIQAAKVGLRVMFHHFAGYSPTETTNQSVKRLGQWQEVRDICRSTHNDFQNACLAKGHSAKAVHDLITKKITGYTAQQARDSLVLIEGDDTIGLNHQPSPLQLEQIAKAKRLYTTYRKGSWTEQVLRAVFHSCDD